MGIFDFAKKQFINVIAWTEPQDGILSYRFPIQDAQIQNGAQLTVRDSQLAMFVNEGVAADVFQPGLHTLTTKNLPILTNLKNWDKAFQSPFKADVYFFSTREQIDQKWGTAQPITIRDQELGALRIRAFGNYSYKIADPSSFYKKIAGTRDVYTVDELEGQLRGAVLTQLATFLGSGSVPFLEMAANQSKFSETLKGVLLDTFKSYGLSLETFYVQSVSLPEEVQQYLDKSSQMHLVGDLQKFAQFQTADSIAAAARNEGGAAGAGVGLGAGMAMAQSMAKALGGAGGSASRSDDALATIDKLHELLKKGILTQAEFDAKKAELLKKIT